MQRSFDLNGILHAGNIMIVLLAIWLYILKGDTQYINNYTIAILAVFGIQNSLLLLWERKSREPLLILLMITIIPFYSLRVLTLLYEPWSVVLPRFQFTPDDMNFALLFIMFAVLSMSIGIKSVKCNYSQQDCTVSDPAGRDRIENRLFYILWLIVIIDLLSTFGINFFGTFRGFFSLIFNADVLLILVLVAYSICKDTFSSRRKKQYWALFFMFIAVRTLCGSRSAAVTFILSCFFVYLAVFAEVNIKRWILLAVLFLLPFSFAVYHATSFWRPYRLAKLNGSSDEPTGEFIRRYVNKTAEDYADGSLKILLRPMFDRIGYLDMTADTITNARIYSSLLNLEYYTKSVIDNVFTPGSDIFDIPKAANNSVTLYHGLPLLKKSEVSSFYQADMFTIFGEYYVLFGGYLAIVPLFLFGFFSKLFLEMIKSGNHFWRYSCRAIFFKLFVLSLWSFGLDWQFADILFGFISLGAILFITTTLKLPDFKPLKQKTC